MTIQANLADGRVLNFPDGTDPSVIQATVKKMLGGQQQQPQQPQQPQDPLVGLPPEVLAGIEERHPMTQSGPTSSMMMGAAGSMFAPGLPRDIAAGQSEQAVMKARRDEAEFEQLRLRNPALAELIESLPPAERLAIGAGAGFAGLGRGAKGLVGLGEEEDPTEKAAREALLQRSDIAKVGKVAAESAPFLAAGPVAGLGLRTTTAGRTLVPAATTLRGKAAGQAALGGLEGATIAKGEGKSDKDVLKAGVIGGVIGAGSEVAAPVVSGLRRTEGLDKKVESFSDLRQLSKEGQKQLKEPTKKEIAKGLEQAVPSIEQLKDTSRGIYKGIEDLGITIKPESIDGLLKEVISTAKRIGFKDTENIKKSVPETVNLMGMTEDLLKQSKIGVDDLENLRRFSQSAKAKAFRAGNPQDSTMADSVTDNIDAFLTNLKSTDMTGAIKNIGQDLATARSLWGRARRAELLDMRMESAELQSSGLENGIRIRFRQILDSDKQKAFFKKEELEAMRQVVEGTKGSNFFKMLGKTGFGRGAQTNVLSGVAATGTVSALINPIAGTLLAGAGTISKDFAERLTVKNAQMANAIVRAGADAETITRVYLKSTPKAQQSADELSQLLMRADIDLDKAKSEFAQAAAKKARSRRSAVAAVVPLQAAAEEEE